jgi:serine/threonine protein kinase
MDEPATAEPASGADFDGTYKLLGELKSGSRSIVYRAEQQKLGSDVAIKVLRDRLPDDPLRREEWNDQVRALAALEHPNLVHIAGFGIAGEAPYIAMELLEGESLATRLARGPLPPELAEQLIQALLRALAYLHVRGVVHRNLSPGALFLQQEADGGVRLKLIDYGQTQLPANQNADQTIALCAPEPSVYSSPEQAAGEDVDARSDVYSAGAIILQMLAGGAVARAAEEQASGRTLLAPQPVAAASPEFHAFIGKALATEPHERFGNADQMLRALLELPTPWFEPANLSTDAPDAAATTEVAAAAVPQHAAEEPVLEGEPVPAESPTPPALPIKRRRLPKKKLLGAAAALTLLGAGGFAAWQQLHNQGSQPAANGGERTPPPSAAKGPAAAETPPGAGAAEQEEEAEQDAEHTADEHAPAAQGGETKPGPAEPGATGAQLPGPQQAAAPPTATQLPQPTGDAHAPAAPDPGAAERGPDGAQAAVAPVPTIPQAPAAPEPEAPPGAAHGPIDAHAAEPQPPVAQAQPPSAEHAAGSAQAPAPTEPTPPAADDAHHAEAPAAAAKPEPSPPTAATPGGAETPAPKPVNGSVRHVRPTPYDIRELLLLAQDKSKPRGAARDPFLGELPKELKVLREAIAKGEPGTAHQLGVLRRFCRDNPDEPIGHLLLAGLYANRGWNLDALDQYDIAFQKDPSSRGDPAMLALALRMVQSGVADADATRFVARSYQREALPAIDQALRDKSLDKAAAARLKKLRARIASGSARLARE